MADDSQAVNTKIDPQAHALLNAIALATDTTVTDIVRKLIHAYLAEEVRKHNVIANAMRSQQMAENAGEITKGSR